LTVLLAIEGYLLIILAVYFLMLLLGHFLTWRYLSDYGDRIPKEAFRPKVSIIKPVKGLDQGMFENLASFCEFEYANDYELLFCVEDKDDPAIPVIKEVMASYPGRETRLVFSETHPAWMGKPTNLIYGIRSSKYDVLVFSDTDTRADQDFLSHLIQPLGNADVGLVYCCPAYRGAKTAGAASMALSVNPGILFHAAGSYFGQVTGAIGTTMALRKEVLSEIGGLESHASQVTTDTPLGRAITERGYRLHVLNTPIPVILEHYSLRDWWRHNHRWSVIIRRYIPLSFAVSPLVGWGVLHALVYLLLAVATGHHVQLAGALLGAVLLAKLGSVLVINATFAREKSARRYVWLAPFVELLGAPSWLAAYLTNQVVWRGMRFRLLSSAVAVQIFNHNEDRT